MRSTGLTAKTVSITYDGLGDVLTRTEANGDLVTNSYSQTGQLLKSITTFINPYNYNNTDTLHSLTNVWRADGSIGAAVEVTSERNVAARGADGLMHYVVQPGDTLRSIAARVWVDSSRQLRQRQQHGHPVVQDRCPSSPRRALE